MKTMAPSQQQKKNRFLCDQRFVNNIFGNSKKITEMTSVINSIAFQTTILALNAAVKAARAGEMGLGFAEIACEVRDLARHSGQAAKEIASLVNESVELVGNGSILVDRAGQTMKEMAASVISVTDTIGEIASASDGPVYGIGRPGKAINEMETPIRQNAALVREAGATAASLEEQASLLINVVSIFRISQTLAAGGVQNVLAQGGR
ncbi:hypothetical protein GRH90_15300 [Enterobacteriales bacterium SAP-6]|uniref:Methyl-accepting transducer domain-containing protein n=1 Tax=Acerihabitans arboris TaxID=2691583 RepID=A0A845SGW6_9GAMM|nr:hypothetical protein [Acerihabitans arboris]